MATRYEKVGGVVDYAEATVGENYAYYLGWFMAAVYFPASPALCAGYPPGTPASCWAMTF